MSLEQLGTLSWQHSIEIPMADGTHALILAYFRTSESGAWVVDDSVPSDQFVQVFRRGTWKWQSGLFGGRKLVPVLQTNGKCPRTPMDAPMRLEVRMRPSPECIVVTLVHWYGAPKYNILWETTINTNFLPYIEAEASGLAEYLKQCLGWAEMPEVRKGLPGPK